MADGDLGHFKGAVFGGFDRRSVANYIEALAGERNDYRSRLEESEELCDKLEAELNAASERERERRESENASLEERERAAAVSEARRVRIVSLSGELKASEHRLAEAGAQLEEAQKRIAELEEAAKSGEGAQERLSAMQARIDELEAAEKKSSARGCESMMRSIKRDYEELCEDAVVTAEQLRRQLARLEARLEDMSARIGSDPENRPEAEAR